MKRIKLVPRAKAIRQSLGMSQQQFAHSYEIPLGTLRDWEQGRAEPDQAAQSYLKAIAHDPKAIRKALKSVV
jgi:putative transcriptional regulator